MAAHLRLTLLGRLPLARVRRGRVLALIRLLPLAARLWLALLWLLPLAACLPSALLRQRLLRLLP